MKPSRINWIDRFALQSWNGYKGGGATVTAAVLMLALAFAPRSFGYTLPLPIVVGLPAAAFAAVMLHGYRVQKRLKGRSLSSRQ